jgi:hypothetical protein
MLSPHSIKSQQYGIKACVCILEISLRNDCVREINKMLQSGGATGPRKTHHTLVEEPWKYVWMTVLQHIHSFSNSQT